MTKTKCPEFCILLVEGRLTLNDLRKTRNSGRCLMFKLVKQTYSMHQNVFNISSKKPKLKARFP
uniref:Uncharacterized protein n=1 Tax=Arundo donax TaxID=35708 RepID=A0A0A9HKE5_ARUDO